MNVIGNVRTKSSGRNKTFSRAIAATMPSNGRVPLYLMPLINSEVKYMAMTFKIK